MIQREKSTRILVAGNRSRNRAAASAMPCDPGGQVRKFVNIFQNDEEIRFLKNLDTPVKDGDEISIVPAIAGGK